MAFHDVSLPDDFQYASQFGAGFATVVQQTASGHEYRIARQSQARHRFRLAKRLQSASEAQTLKQFGLGRRGSLHSFRLKDWSDFSSATDGQSAPTNLDCVLGTGDGSEQQFQLSKTYDISGAAPYVRTITLPVDATTVVAVDGVAKTEGVDYTLTNPNGIVTFASAPTGGQVVTAGFQFDVPARFESSFDQWNALRADAFDVWSLADLDAVEVLDELEAPELWYPGGGTEWGTVGSDITLSMAQGELHRINASTNINAFLPAVPTLFPGGPRVFVVIVHTGTGNVQLRDDAGNTVGSAIASGTTKRVGCLVSGGTATWVSY